MTPLAFFNELICCCCGVYGKVAARGGYARGTRLYLPSHCTRGSHGSDGCDIVPRSGAALSLDHCGGRDSDMLRPDYSTGVREETGKLQVLRADMAVRQRHPPRQEKVVCVSGDLTRALQLQPECFQRA